MTSNSGGRAGPGWPGPPARLKDVAARAGVSVKTVSNVVNDFPYVSTATRERVQRAVAELSYRPNVNARNLRSGRSGVIALAVPELHSPYFSELAHHVVRAALQHDWTVLVDETEGLRDRERAVVAGIRGQLIDGAILSPLALDEECLAAARTAAPVVLLGERLGSGLADHVGIDNETAAREAIEHLVAQGRRRIAVIGDQDPPYGHTARVRLQGYRAALAGAGLPFDERLVVPAAQWWRRYGAAGAERLLQLDPRPDAVFCLNDLLALGALRALAVAGVAVPDDVAVVGFDDIEESRYSVPSLTTVAPDKQAIAEQAVQRLATRLGADGTDGPEEITLGHTLHVRESS